MTVDQEDRMHLLATKVRELHGELDKQISAFQSSTGLHCLFGCGKCCLKPDIEATPLEFLPLAEALYQEGKAEEWMQKIESGGDVCKVYDEGQGGAGKCSRYFDRGMICRLFGYSARLNKYGTKDILTCTTIKEGQQQSFLQAASSINEGLQIPLATDFYTRLRGIDPDLGSIRLPVNQAIYRALETVVTYYYYRNGRQG